MPAQQRSIFSLTRDEEGNVQKLVKCCESVPAILKVGDPDKDEDQQMLRSEFKQNIKMLWRNPGLIMKNNHWFEGKIRVFESAAPEDCFKHISTLGALDEAWARAWIVGRSQLTIAYLELACQKDPESWEQILIYALKCVLATNVPLQCRKSVLASSLDCRHIMCGKRLDELDTTGTGPQAIWGMCPVMWL